MTASQTVAAVAVSGFAWCWRAVVEVSQSVVGGRFAAGNRLGIISTGAQSEMQQRGWGRIRGAEQGQRGIPGLSTTENSRMKG